MVDCVKSQKGQILHLRWLGLIKGEETKAAFPANVWRFFHAGMVYQPQPEKVDF